MEKKYSEKQKKRLQIINRNFLIVCEPEFDDKIEQKPNANLTQFHQWKELAINYLDKNDLIESEEDKKNILKELSQVINQNSGSLEKLANSSLFSTFMSIAMPLIPILVDKYGQKNI